jgi:hypothetical protein
MNGPGRANAAAGNFIDDPCTVTTRSDKVGTIASTAMLISSSAMNGAGNAMIDAKQRHDVIQQSHEKF